MISIFFSYFIFYCFSSFYPCLYAPLLALNNKLQQMPDGPRAASLSDPPKPLLPLTVNEIDDPHEAGSIPFFLSISIFFFFFSSFSLFFFQFSLLPSPSGSFFVDQYSPRAASLRADSYGVVVPAEGARSPANGPRAPAVPGHPPP